MSSSQGFWSYVHNDDEAEGGRVSRLARDVAAQFELLTGEQLKLFLDKDGIEWGENWRQTIDSNLSTVAFFIALITPRYFRSSECRRELQYFARKAIDIGIKDLAARGASSSHGDIDATVCTRCVEVIRRCE